MKRVTCSGSKSSKRSLKCKYIFKQGPMKNKRCDKGCRGEYCNNHKPKKIVYMSSYGKCKRTNIKTRNYEEKLQKLRATEDIDQLSLPEYTMRIKNLCSDYIYLKKRLIGVNMYLGLNVERDIESMKVNKPCTCIEVKDMNDIPKEIIEEYNDDPATEVYHNGNIIESVKSSKRCVECDKVDFNSCVKCKPYVGRVLYFPFDGDKTAALLKKKKLVLKMTRLKLKIKSAKEIASIMESRIKELSNE